MPRRGTILPAKLDPPSFASSVIVYDEVDLREEACLPKYRSNFGKDFEKTFFMRERIKVI